MCFKDGQYVIFILLLLAPLLFNFDLKLGCFVIYLILFADIMQFVLALR